MWTVNNTKCCLSSQRYNFLKANHNYLLSMGFSIQVVYQVKDTIFWKQITTELDGKSYQFSCLSSQRYNFLKANHNLPQPLKQLLIVVYQVKDTIFWIENRRSQSKSQLFPVLMQTAFSCLSSQRYNFLKANHNPMAIGVTTAYVVYQVKDTIFWIENRRASRGATLNRTPTSYVLIEGVTWSDTLNTILPLKAMI